MNTFRKIQLFDREYYALDLTHKLNPNIPTWNASCGFESETVLDYEMSGVLVKKYKCHAGIGTHMDAPSHFFNDGLNIAQIPLEKLIVPVCKIDVSPRAHSDYMLSKQDIVNYEKHYGSIKPNTLIVADTGWSSRWSDSDSYRNEDDKGNMHFPGYSPECASYLLDLDIVGIGIDTLSPDGSDKTFPVHKLLLGSSKYIIENLTNLADLPPTGAFIIALPLKIQDGAESAIRALALIPK
ncbi:MAG: cyclase family protein [Simkaniaceae bacterium]|nr:cyclase family protein [Simkaniaceae bacterium]